MPEIFGRYQLVKKLAVGGMGEVFLARQKGPVGFEKYVVVKRLLPHLTDEQDFINMFFDEARIAALLNHPNIAQIYDLGEVDDTYYIAMEYVHGENLRFLSNKAKEKASYAIPLPVKARIIAEAAAALDFAHRAKSPSGALINLIHRDVSPQNIIVGYNGTVKLIDFGVAKAQGKITRTATGIIKGKYAYMSPEQARGEELDARSDVFGLGIIFYELLADDRLFKRDNDTATLRAVVGDNIILPSKLGKNVPKALDAVVMKALERDRNDRYASAQEFQLAIEEFLNRQRMPASSTQIAAFMKDTFPDRSEMETHQENSHISVVSSVSRITPATSAMQSHETSSISESEKSGKLKPSVSNSHKQHAKTRDVSSSRPSAEPAKAAVTTSGLSSTELKKRLASVVRSDTVRGLFFNSLMTTVLRELGPDAEVQVRKSAEEPKYYVDALAYSTADFLRVLWKAVQLLSPTLGNETALLKLGANSFDALCASPLGRSLNTLAPDAPPSAVVKPLLATLKTMFSPGDRLYIEASGSAGKVVFKEEALPLGYYSGMLGQAFLETQEKKVTTHWERTAAGRFEMELRW